jgi:hypothetical protein
LVLSGHKRAIELLALPIAQPLQELKLHFGEPLDRLKPRVTQRLSLTDNVCRLILHDNTS